MSPKLLALLLVIFGSILGALYSLFIVVMLVAIGTFYFHESLSARTSHCLAEVV